MKTIFNLKQVIVVVTLLIGATSYAQMGVGTTSPNSNAMLDIESTSRGLLPPRMTTAQRTAISPSGTGTSGDNGLLVYDTDENAYYFWNGSSWQVLGAADSSLGNIYLTSSYGVSLTQNSPQQVLGTSSLVNSTGFSQSSNGVLQYTGTATKTFTISMTLSISFDGFATEDMQFYFILNDGSSSSEIAGTRVTYGQVGANLFGSPTGDTQGNLITIVGTVELSEDDEVELWMVNTARSSSVTIDNYNILIK